MLNCRYLDSMQESSTQYQDSQQMVVKASQVDHSGFIKFLLSYCSISWYTQVKLEEV